MASVCNFIICTDEMACEKICPTCGGAFCHKWENHSTYSRTKNPCPRQGFLAALVLDKGEYPRGHPPWERFAYFSAGKSKCHAA